jgi:hypothetical protein
VISVGDDYSIVMLLEKEEAHVARRIGTGARLRSDVRTSVRSRFKVVGEL